MTNSFDTSALFERAIQYPDPDARARLGRMIGIDEEKARLSKLLGLLVNAAGFRSWADRHHPDGGLMVDTVLKRPPLVILAGDVGSGKTELAQTIGDAVARQEEIQITLLPLSLATRGQGKVGEMTTLLTAAFDHTASEARKLKSDKGSKGAVILLVDEADALAQSREALQMHHEDRSGVNAFIRGIDRLAIEQLPAAVIMCTNRGGALDPAVRRRAAEMFSFERPNDDRRRDVLEPRLKPVGFSDADIAKLVKATGPRCKGAVGFTYSDLTQRLIPAMALDAYPDGPMTSGRALEIAAGMLPTPPFNEQDFKS
jgi:AAA+ superfamily predicted ATPase